MQIGRKDVIWNYAATFMRIASGIIILPLVLKLLPSEEYGLWNIFLTISTLPALFDFGFSNSFTRNVAYVYSGVTELKSEGFIATNTKYPKVDFGLLKSVIGSMQRYYGIMAVIFLVVFTIGSPFYMSSVLEKYSGNKQEIWIAWFVYGAIVAYEFYTYYYNSLMTGRGFIKRNMQIVILSQSLRIIVSVICLLLNMGLLSMIIGMLVGDILNRTFSYYSFFDKKTSANLRTTPSSMPVMKVMKLMAPNALKIGLTTLGYFTLSQAIMLISPYFLSLSEIAQYGISKQMIGLIYSIGGTWFGTFYPQLNRYRVHEDQSGIKRLYLKGIIVLFVIFITAGSGLLLLGNPILQIIHSKTMLLNNWLLALMLVFSFFEAVQSISTSTLLTKNEVPFFKAVLISGACSLLLLFILLESTDLGVLCMILVPGIALMAYNNWKWPGIVMRELNVKPVDFYHIIVDKTKILILRFFQ